MVSFRSFDGFGGFVSGFSTCPSNDNNMKGKTTECSLVNEEGIFS